MKTVAEAATYLDMADKVLQPHGAEPTNFRFGASGLLNDIVNVLGSSHDAAVVDGLLVAVDTAVPSAGDHPAKRDGRR